MVETLAGIWLFLLTFFFGFWSGKRHGVGKKVVQKKHQKAESNEDFGWRELLNFLQYDGSGTDTDDRMERGMNDREANHIDGADTARVRTGRSV